MSKITRSDKEWAEQLDAEQFRNCREKGTEPAYSGKYWDAKEKGMYRCTGCGEPLFSSETKYDSGSGWTSFFQPLDSTKVNELVDNSHGMHRTEVVCNHCDSHLGPVS